ncbi:MAG: 3'(2'),5'-bisphosphate nucleotidase CysQ [SAR86 cluster bacterium]|uniref:3'(2'),5'-bisphosphate nucleotidase CysQ n=1 Tax=SAR86 cluster bacterium TaxID=2030880 RepID=A0A973A8G3_9GAMM|nr:3'(2'),5'-bisphosphate nucleotidase CysQ [SAR86 cluster bacterium]
MQDVLEGVITIAREAGAAIMDVYSRDDFGIESKSDDSPLTAADLAANAVILAGLKRLAPDIPVLSEESDEVPFSERQQWLRYFLVDPLDGTKEFINRNGEFTVNIALIDHGVPVLGVVYVPVLDVLYAGLSGPKAGDGASLAFVERDDQRQDIAVRKMAPRITAAESVVVVASRRHSSPAMEHCMATLTSRFPTLETLNMGSSLKLCLIAEGQADLYPRLAPTSEWDTAAAHAVVIAAGGEVVDDEFVPLRYNTKAGLLNPYFYVLGDVAFDWRACLI